MKPYNKIIKNKPKETKPFKRKQLKANQEHRKYYYDSVYDYIIEEDYWS